MRIKVEPGFLRGRVERMICSKSQGHRALICAAMAETETLLTGLDENDDLMATEACLKQLGAGFRREAEGIRISPLGPPVAEQVVLDCGESGSTLRFLLPLAAVRGQKAALTGRGRLSQRPLSPLYEEMQAHGVQLSEQGSFPLTVAGKMRAGEYALAGNVSSQFISGLLMALPKAEGDSLLRITGSIQSRPYIQMTLEMLETFGVHAEDRGDSFRIPGNSVFQSPGRLRVEGDWSGAAFWLAAGALSEAGVVLGGLNPDSAQGDRAMLDLVRQFGAETAVRGDELTVRKGRLRGIRIDAANIPDLVPALAVVAAAAEGETRICRISRLRLKESDRVQSVLALLHTLGVAAEADEDEMRIQGRAAWKGGVIDSFRDHRIVMAAAVAGSAARETLEITGAEAVSKSYPGFFEQFRALGGRAKEVQT